MPVTIITPATLEPITIEEARAQCRASSVEDSFLALCIAGARAKCEGILQRALINRTVSQTYPAFDPAGLRFLLEPVVSVAQVTYTAPAGDTITLAGSAYQLSRGGLSPLLLPAYQTAWPETRATPEAVTVQYVAGYGSTAAAVPADVRTWLLLTVAYLYAQREAFDLTGRVSEVPSRFVDGLLDPYRRYDYTA